VSDIGTAWVCEPCEVGGVDVDMAPSCWCCGGPVKVTARPAINQLRDRVIASYGYGYEVGT
jgi:hypothetical protein